MEKNTLKNSHYFAFFIENRRKENVIITIKLTIVIES